MEHHLEEEDMEHHQAEGMERHLEEDMVEDMGRPLQLIAVMEEVSHHLAGDTAARLLAPIRSCGTGSRASIPIDLGLSRRLSWRGR